MRVRDASETDSPAYCAGLASDKAGSGEVWLSSQNRNFKDRMGKGSIGNLASAATCAACVLARESAMLTSQLVVRHAAH